MTTTASPPPPSRPKATPVFRTFAISIPKTTWTGCPGETAATAICLVTWSTTMTSDAHASARAQAPTAPPLVERRESVSTDAVRCVTSRLNRAHDDRPRDDEHDRRDD